MRVLLRQWHKTRHRLRLHHILLDKEVPLIQRVAFLLQIDEEKHCFRLAQGRWVECFPQQDCVLVDEILHVVSPI